MARVPLVHTAGEETHGNMATGWLSLLVFSSFCSRVHAAKKRNSDMLKFSSMYVCACGVICICGNININIHDHDPRSKSNVHVHVHVLYQWYMHMSMFIFEWFYMFLDRYFCFFLLFSIFDFPYNRLHPTQSHECSRGVAWAGRVPIHYPYIILTSDYNIFL